MKVFVSYADEDREVAERVVRSLRNRNHDVFYDKDRLPAARTFEERIEEQIGLSDVFVFLVSPHSVEPGTFALTEAHIAERRWERPDSRILPVQVVATEFEKIPLYLRSVTIYKPKGDVAAETAIEVERMRSNRWSARTLVLAVIAVIVVGAGAFWTSPWERLHYLTVGSESSKVRAALCLPPIVQAGKPDATTEEALAYFRQALESKVKGPLTFPEWQDLVKAEACPSQYQNAFERFGYPDARSIKALQRSLIDSRLSTGAPPAETGTFDQETRNAIRQVRIHAGLPPGSQVTPELIERLSIAIKDARQRTADARAAARTKVEDALNKIAAIDDFKREYLYAAFKKYNECRNPVDCKAAWKALHTQLITIYSAVTEARLAISNYRGDLFGDGAKLDFRGINEGLASREALVLSYLDPNAPAPSPAVAKQLEEQHKKVAQEIKKELQALKAKLDGS